MRAAVLIAVLACATAAHAEGSRESRYGPAPERAPKAMNGRAPGYTGQAYTGRSLGWSGKREMVAPTAQAASQAQPWWARSAPQAPQPPQAPQARPAFQPQTPVYAPQAPQARELPQSIYDAPLAPAAPLAQAPLYQPQQQASLPNGQVGARSYSVGRQFGMAPDAIPAAGPPRMVLIAPPASAPEDEDKPREDGEWSAKPDKDGQ
ncbi:hypothetical protein [Caulobacter segnis]